MPYFRSSHISPAADAQDHGYSTSCSDYKHSPDLPEYRVEELWPSRLENRDDMLLYDLESSGRRRRQDCAMFQGQEMWALRACLHKSYLHEDNRSLNMYVDSHSVLYRIIHAMSSLQPVHRRHGQTCPDHVHNKPGDQNASPQSRLCSEMETSGRSGQLSQWFHARPVCLIHLRIQFRQSRNVVVLLTHSRLCTMQLPTRCRSSYPAS